jgi:hypothetical protein
MWSQLLALAFGAILFLPAGASPGVAATSWADPVRISNARLLFPSLAIDRAGRPHIVARGVNGIFHFVLIAGTWRRTRLTTDYRGARGHVTAQLPQVAVDQADGSVTVVYARTVDDGSVPGSPGKLRYRTLRAGHWSGALSIPAAVEGDYSVAVAGGRLAVALQTGMYDSASVRFVTNAGGSWTSEEFGSARLNGPYGPSLVLDSRRRPHIAYLQKRRVKYARGTTRTGDFVRESVVTHEQWLGSVSLALGSDDRPRLAFQDDEHAWYAYRVASGWHETPIGEHSLALDLALEPDGSPHVLLAAGVEGLWHATKGGGSWTRERLDTHDTGQLGGIAVAASGALLVAYVREDPRPRVWFRTSE